MKKLIFLIVAAILGLTTCKALYGPAEEGQHKIDANEPIGFVLPNIISGLVLWLDADDSAFDATCTIPVSDGETVACWKDKSLFNRNATIGTFPTFSTINPLNNKKAIIFDGTKYITTAAAFPVFDVSNCDSTVITVTYTNLYDGVYRPFFQVDHNTALGAHHAIINNFYQTTGTFMISNISVGVPIILSSTINGGTNIVYQNGLNKFSGSFNCPATASTSYTIGKKNADFFTGYIAEIIVYNRVLSDIERQGVEKYLSIKYSIPLY